MRWYITKALDYIRDYKVPCAVAGFLFVVGVLKMIQVDALVKVVDQISFLPDLVRQYLPLVLPFVEVALALFILWSVTRVTALLCTCVMFVGFIGFHIWNILYGHITSCHCLGVEDVFGFSYQVNAGIMIVLLCIAILMILSWLSENSKLFLWTNFKYRKGLYATHENSV
jgi:hypothetical protein